MEFNRNFQREFLAVCVQDKDFLCDIEQYMDYKFFEDESLKFIYKEIIKYTKQYNDLPDKFIFDFLLTNNALKSYYPDIENIYNPRSQSHMKFVTDKTLDFVKYSRAREVMSKSQGLLNSGKFDELADKMFQAFDVKPEDPDDSGWLYKEAEERVNAYHKNKPIKIGIGLGKAVDDCFDGGVGFRTLNVIIGKANAGKTMCLTNIAISGSLQGFKVLHFTLEMTKEEILARYDACIGKIDTNMIYSDNDSIREKTIHHLKLNSKNGGEVFVKRYSNKTANCWTFKNDMNKLKRKFNFVPDMIIVDYAAIMRHEGPADTQKRLQLEETFLALRRLAQDEKVVVWTANQLNREGMKADKPDFTNISEDISVSFTADNILFIVQSPDEELSGTMRIINGKSRHSKNNVVATVLADKAKSFIGDISPFQSGIQKEDQETDEELLEYLGINSDSPLQK